MWSQRKCTHQRNVLQTGVREEEEEPVHLKHSGIVPFLGWTREKHMIILSSVLIVAM